jgi:hypothetical protein
MNVDWTDAKVETLRIGVADGKSAGLLAEQFRCTRNAIIGKCHRLKLQLKGRQTRVSTRVPSAQSKPRRAPAAPKCRAKPMPAPIVDPAKVAAARAKRFADAFDPANAPEPARLTPFAHSTNAHCMWVYAQDGQKLVCGCTRVQGKRAAYCEAHTRLATSGGTSITQPETEEGTADV